MHSVATMSLEVWGFMLYHMRVKTLLKSNQWRVYGEYRRANDIANEAFSVNMTCRLASRVLSGRVLFNDLASSIRRTRW